MIENIGVIGVGFVGGSVINTFVDKGVNAYRWDKYKDLGGTIEELSEKSEIVFLCLPTPFVEGHGFDISALQEACKSLRNNSFDGVVLVKSTVEPGISEFLANRYGLRVMHNPEFLTARTAQADFENQSHIVLGLTSKSTHEDLAWVMDFYKKHFPDATISIASSNETESMKLFVNNFYAMKVQMFNEFYLLCQRTGADFDVVREMMLRNGWINPMHTLVPGPDGSLSYGGACFPKDTNALKKYMDRMGTPNEILSACISERNKMRKD